MLLECTVVQKISKAGNPYNVLRVDLGHNAYLEPYITNAEIAVLALKASEQDHT